MGPGNHALLALCQRLGAIQENLGSRMLPIVLLESGPDRLRGSADAPRQMLSNLVRGDVAYLGDSVSPLDQALAKIRLKMRELGCPGNSCFVCTKERLKTGSGDDDLLSFCSWNNGPSPSQT
tara:strand:- start:53 stop:418 length:366 start_codon:yes stop_codon:yes gene_type:complete